MKHVPVQQLPIGVFDSGLGGLTVIREIRKSLPHENLIYFGDLARLPYGIKSKRQIVEFSRQNTEFLIGIGIKALVIACNSSASAAASVLKREYPIPVLDVIVPAAQEAIRVSAQKRIGIIGTQATIASGAYVRILKWLDSSVTVKTQACPLLVPIVEEGVLEGKIPRAVIERYLEPLMRAKIDALILGCTHYPLLAKEIRKYIGSAVRLVDSAVPTAYHLCSMLREKELLAKSTKRGKLRVFVSDVSQSFFAVGERFLGQSLGDVKLVKLAEVATIKRRWMA